MSEAYLRPDDRDIVAAIPAGGWRVRWDPDEDSERESEPLVGWGVRRDGTVVPLATDVNGEVEQLDEHFVTPHHIYHPDRLDETRKADVK